MKPKTRARMAAAIPFAHLLGVRADEEDGDGDDEKKRKDDEAKRAKWSEKAETDEARKQGKDESDEDYAKRMEEMDEEEKDDKGKKSKRAEDDDADDESLEKESDEEKAARRAERARCAKIIAHGIKTGAVRQAGIFAFDTAMTVAAAIAALDAGKLDSEAGKRGALKDRMAAVGVSSVGPGAGEAPDVSSPKAIAAMIVAAGRKARGEK